MPAKDYYLLLPSALASLVEARMHSRFCSLLCVLLLSGSGLSARVIKIAPPPPPPRSAPTLLQLTQKAGYIFSGTVLSVERDRPQASDEVATVRITFRVDQALRGVSSRQTLTVREWAGLWDSGDRYFPGEQVLLFLYQPSKLGLTSPVNGNFGRFKLDNRGQILLDAQRLADLQIQTPASPGPPPGKKVTLGSNVMFRAIRQVRY